MPLALNKQFLLRLIIYIPLIAWAAYILIPRVYSNEYNDFDLSDSLIPINEIHHGGPPRDGIPSIDKPVFVDASKASFLKNNDDVLGLSFNGINKAYPIRILNWHEIVNDKFNKESVLVSYCPLCGTGMIFKPSASQEFGVSGLLYNSDMLLYDRETESLWSQILGKAISGPLKGLELKMLPSEHTSWLAWKTRHPDTQVLSTITGYSRDYSRNPYQGYELSKGLYFPVKFSSMKYHPKERVIGIKIGNQTKAYPFAELSKLENNQIQDTFADQTITIHFDVKNRSGTITDQNNKPIPIVNSFWFAWYAFHPETKIYNAP